MQGVGFRPAVYRWAMACGLAGFVRNEPAGVVMDVEGEEERIRRFFAQFGEHTPPLAEIGRVTRRRLPPRGYNGFAVWESHRDGRNKVDLPPDVAVCDACLAEMWDPGDRRYRYPFINCVDCGPRFSIVTALPYDRPHTAMKDFVLCDECAAEYSDPGDRRFHAQPNACPDCGPQIFLLGDGTGGDGSLEQGRWSAIGDEALAGARQALERGEIVAVKGIGGYHLACNALDATAVGRLRARKSRRWKSLAVMFRDLDTLCSYLTPTPEEIAEITSPARPIVIVDGRLNDAISPDTGTTGVFLPYTPLHHLLLESFPALVMTSGNRRDEPIAIDESAALRLVGPIADRALANDRPIHGRCDDSVVRMMAGERRTIRRSRGYVPAPVRIATASSPVPAAGSPSVLAAGADLKNTFCITRGGEAYLSQHIGELSEASALDFYRTEIGRWLDLLQVEPVAVAYDLHPGYLSTQYARELPAVERIGVQHHHAHIASVLGERGIDRPVIGIALDGTGYGEDGTIWGGEFLRADRQGFERLARFKPYPLPGGDRAIEEPWRMAMSVLSAESLDRAVWASASGAAGTFGRSGERTGPGAWLTDGRGGRIEEMLAAGLNSPLTSSAGRLFDAAAALLGLCDVAEYEAQAAIRLETAAGETEPGAGAAGAERGRVYSFILHREESPWTLDFGPAFAELTEDRRRGEPMAVMAARFLDTVAAGVVATAAALCSASELDEVALSGGVFQNDRLLVHVSRSLVAAGMVVHTNSLVPTNDGGVSLGQAVVAAARLAGMEGRLCA